MRNERMSPTTGRPGGRARGLVAAGLAALALAACDRGEANEAPSVQATAVERGDLRITAEATGTVEPIRKVEVKSKASGEILELHVDVGDDVEPGALLARVDPRDVRNRYDQAEADLEVAQAGLDIAEAQLQRSRELLESGVITQQEFESANLEYANAQAAFVKAQTNFELSELQLTDVTIRAPMAGTILQKSVEEGQVIQSASQNVSGGTTLFVMAALEAMQVRTLVDETDVGEIRAGMPAQVRVEAYPDRGFEGEVLKVEPQAIVEQNVTMFPVIVTLDNRSDLLRPGMNAEVEVLIDEAQDVLLVPNNTVVTLQDVIPAASALGLDPNSIDLSRFRPGRPGGVGEAAGDDGDAGEAAAATRPDGPGGASMDSLRARVERGEISQDSARALVRALRGGDGGATDAGAAGPAVAAGGSAPGSGVTVERRPRPAVVFVMTPEGPPEPRVVMIGLNDWESTQVVSGLEEGDRVAVIGAAQLQAQQQEFLNRVRGRSGGPFR